jgi:hypothetical protein
MGDKNDDCEERGTFEILKSGVIQNSGRPFEMAKVVDLVDPNATLQVSARLLINKCDLFFNDPELTALPYHLKSRVSVSDFREFISALEGTTVKVTSNNFKGLSQLCEEFHFRDLWHFLTKYSNLWHKMSFLSVV